MSDIEKQWCSWCYEKTTHELVTRNIATRNDYQCSSCGNHTVKCRSCSNMAIHRPAEPTSESKKFLGAIKENWANEFCAEHNGTIADFGKLNHQLDDLAEYEELFKRAKWDLAKGGKIAGGMIAGTAIFSPLAFIAAPAIATALGSLGTLGAATTGIAIKSLSGAALTSASLAALGPGGVAGGIAFISAAGAALGGAKGATISNNYFGAIQDFKITKVKEGTGPAVIFINGFLSQKNQDSNDWEKAIVNKHADNPCYYVNWESSSLYKIGSLIGESVGEQLFEANLKKLMNRGSSSFSNALGPLSWVKQAGDLLGNPWHTSMVKASMTGILLADLISRTKNDDGFILMGHSLGARVIYYLLNALATQDKSLIQDVFLLGGAVDRKDQEGWEAAVKSIDGHIYNFYSQNDRVLKFMYTAASGFTSAPIGLGKIEYNHDKIVNIDKSSIIDGHMEYKQKFAGFLDEI